MTAASWLDRKNPKQRALIDDESMSAIEYLEQDYDRWGTILGETMKRTDGKFRVLHVLVDDFVMRRPYERSMFSIETNHNCVGHMSTYCPERTQAQKDKQ